MVPMTTLVALPVLVVTRVSPMVLTVEVHVLSVINVGVHETSVNDVAASVNATVTVAMTWGGHWISQPPE